MTQAGSQSAVYIEPIGESDPKEMSILSMDENSINSLANGERVLVYMQPSSPGKVSLIDPEPISLNTLRAFIPAVDKAVAERTKTGSSKIAFLVFPSNDVDVYRRLFDWMGICVYVGEILPFHPAPPLPEHTESFRAKTLNMTQQLGLGWVEEQGF